MRFLDAYPIIRNKLNRAKRYARKKRKQLRRELEKITIEALQEIVALIFRYEPEGGFEALSQLQRHIGTVKRSVDRGEVKVVAQS